jgi:hypothetical protein
MTDGSSAHINEKPRQHRKLVRQETDSKTGLQRNRLSNETGLQKKKEQGGKPCSKNCVDPISPKNWI